MSNFDEYSIFGGKTDSRTPMKERRVSKRWVRCKEASEIYSIGRTALTEKAKKAKAFIEMDGINLIDTYAFNQYIEEHRVR